MFVKLIPWYDEIAADPYYTHKITHSIPSLATYDDKFRVPDLLLTVQYRIDPKTKRLTHDAKLWFRVDGPSNCQLNFPRGLMGSSHYPVGTDRYEFSVDMDVLFGADTTLTRTGKLGANAEMDAKVAKVGVDGSYEMGKQYPDTRVTVHGLITGTLDAKAAHNRLTHHGMMFDPPGMRRTR